VKTIYSVLLITLLSTIAFAELISVGTKAPSFALPTLTGSREYLSTWAAPKLKKPYLNKIKHTIIVAYWATYCAPCQREIPQLEAYIKARSDSPIKLFLINVENMTTQKLSAFVKEKGWTNKVLHDPYMRVAKNYGVEALPSLFVINGDGMITYANKGFDPSHGSIDEILDGVIFATKEEGVVESTVASPKPAVKPTAKPAVEKTKKSSITIKRLPKTTTKPKTAAAKPATTSKKSSVAQSSKSSN
jgi:peroxiredoxin